MKKTLLHTWALLGLGLLVACASWTQTSAAASGAAKAPLVIAHVAPASGRFALHAEADRRGAEMAVEEFNARGGVLGREVVLITRDPTLDKARAAQVAQQLITESKVGFLLGAIDSGVAASMSAVCQQYGVLFINTNSSAPSEAVEHAHRSKFTFDANGANFNRALLQYALAQHPGKRVVLLTEDNDWGRSNAAASRAIVAEYGGSVVGEVVVPVALPDPAGALRQVAAIPAEVVAVNVSGSNQIRLFAQIDPAVFEKQSWVVGEVDWEELYPVPGTPRPLYGTTWAWNLDTPGTAQFVARYRERYRHTQRQPYPGDVTHAAYLATKALLAAIERTGSTDNHALIRTLESVRWSARERMQHDDAFMDPVSHHLQQTIYIATWKPRPDRPELSQVILGHLPPAQVRYAPEGKTQLEPLAGMPHYAP